MACDRNPVKVGAAGAASGIPPVNAMLGYNLGQIAAKLPDFTTVAETSGAVSDAVLRVIDPTDLGTRQAADTAISIAKTAITLGAWATGVKPTLDVASKVVGVTGLVTGVGGNLMAALCKSGDAGTVEIKKRFLLFSTSIKKVGLTKSNALTPLFNRADVLPGSHVENSKGTLFRVGGMTWHWGESNIHTSRGQQTITHLQTLAIPAQHYYFNRPVGAKDMVELARGAKKPETIEGFSGSVSRVESLCTGWASVKHDLILAKLHWPPSPNKEKTDNVAD